VVLGRGGSRSTGAADGGHHGHRGGVATPFSSIAGASTNHTGLAAAAAILAAVELGGGRHSDMRGAQFSTRERRG
jgi:hypothetical protein